MRTIVLTIAWVATITASAQNNELGALLGIDVAPKYQRDNEWFANDSYNAIVFAGEHSGAGIQATAVEWTRIGEILDSKLGNMNRIYNRFDFPREIDLLVDAEYMSQQLSQGNARVMVIDQYSNGSTKVELVLNWGENLFMVNARKME